MQFKDIKQGNPIYILDKSNVSVSQGIVKGVTFPHADTSKAMFGNSNMVVDVTIEADGKTATYTIPETLQITYAGNLVLATNKESLSVEVENMKTNAKNILASVSHQEDVIANADKALELLNPIYKEKAEQEKRLSNLESSVNKMSELLTSFIEKQRT